MISLRRGLGLKRLVLPWIVLIALLEIVIALSDSTEVPLVEATILHNESISSSSTLNNSGVQSIELNAAAQAPKIMVIGKGYYSDHPISYDSQMGKQTWIRNRATGASMNHEMESAHNINQTLSMSMQDSYQQDETGMIGSSGVQMKVVEDVEEGKVSIGVLQGGTPGNGQSPSAIAWRNPSLEIDEDYIGTFHIEKNMSIQVPFRELWNNYSWLPCCSEDYHDIWETSLKYSGPESIFDIGKGDIYS